MKAIAASIAVLLASAGVCLAQPVPTFSTHEHCQRLAGSRPEECLFIDDLHENVQAAKDLGWHGIVYKPNNGLAKALQEHGVVGH